MKLIKKANAHDGYGFALIANDSQFGVIYGYEDGDLENKEMDIEPEWFETEDRAAKKIEAELEWWNS